MVHKQLPRLVEKLSPGTQLTTGWDERLPYYAAIVLANGLQLIIARSGDNKHYVLSIVEGTTSVRSSIVASLDGPDFDKIVAVASGALSAKDAATDLREPTSAGGAGVSVTHSAGPDLSATGLGSGSRLRASPLAGVAFNRDPNLPPGFEDEHQLTRPGHSGPTLDFNPDADLYPPGGRYPTLSPLGPAQGLFGPDTNNPLREPGTGGPLLRDPSDRGPGMVPKPFGLHQPPNIRRDPTSPFDRGSQPGSGPSGGGPYGMF